MSARNNLKDYQEFVEKLHDDKYESKQFFLVFPFDKERVDQGDKNYYYIGVNFSPKGDSFNNPDSWFNGDDSVFTEILEVFREVVEDGDCPIRQVVKEHSSVENIVWNVYEDDYPELVEEIVNAFDNDFYKKNKEMEEKVSSIVEASLAYFAA